ncbi:hypothetical protein [Nonomuraea zeae]|nr:hypothetical protein [Nonomuraea zeae]
MSRDDTSGVTTSHGIFGAIDRNELMTRADLATVAELIRELVARAAG